MPRRFTTNSIIALWLTAACFAGAAGSADAQPPNQPPQAFARATIDVGCVVSDVDAAVKFYTQAVGMKEVDGFDVPAGFATRAGLTDQRPLSIRVLVLGDDDTATKLKLMEVPGANSRPSDNTTIHSQLGFSYLTIFVTDMDAAVERLKRAQVKILGEGPVELPAELAAGVYLTVVRDPDGNLVELVGPKKQ